MATFIAALALPFYCGAGLQPQFSLPLLRRRSVTSSHTVEPTRIPQHVADLQYYMTLSMHSRSVGSIIWSIFWQPDIECNLVSPWLASILSVIKPVLISRNLEQLVKVFAFRRPRIASWWLGLFLLGDLTILDHITRYLETLEERWGYGSMAPPDMAVAAWTGSPQSFLDDELAHPYRDLDQQASRVDLLRHRHNCGLQDESSRTLSWRPFGHIAKGHVEPELWPWLERGHVRNYVHWVWWIKKGKETVCDIQPDFRRDTGRFILHIPDRLQTISERRYAAPNYAVKIEPSREATLLMVRYCLEDASGDRDTCILAMPGIVSHPWLKH
jgi:hypothetical protein